MANDTGHTRMSHDAPYDWNGPWWMFCPRQVCAKRARALRKRGRTIAYACRTSTGKARYWWDSIDARAPAPQSDEDVSRG